jgi:hypothetical protein
MFLVCSRFCALFTKTSITFSYGVCFRFMITQFFQKKYTHLNVFTKNQGRAAALPCPIGSFAPGYTDMMGEVDVDCPHLSSKKKNTNIVFPKIQS